MRPLALVALVVALAPLATSQSLPQGDEVDIVAVRLPDLVAVEHAFGVEVDVRSKAAEEITVQLATFLYVHEEGRTCGSHTEERFLGPIDRGATPSINLQPGEAKSFPFAGSDPWWHVVNASQVVEPGTYQVCVFALEPGTPQGLKYHDYHASTLQVRVANALPAVDFLWGPPQGNVTTEFTFTADVGDDPEGDALSFHWDFGHQGAKGRATADGAVVTHKFFHFSPSPKTYDVTLTVSDGFDEASIVKTVIVDPEGTPRPQKVDLGPDDEDATFWTRLLPGPGVVTMVCVAALAAVALARGRRAGFR